MTDSKQSQTVFAFDQEQLKRLLTELRSLSRAIAASNIRPDLGTEKNARYLRVFGFSQQEIADLLGVTQPTVNEALSKGRKK